MSSTYLITEALGAALAPADLLGQALLEADILIGNVRTRVAGALKAGWPGETLEVTWRKLGDLLELRAYGELGSVGVVIFGIQAGADAMVGTAAGRAGLTLDRDVLKAVLA